MRVLEGKTTGLALGDGGRGSAAGSTSFDGVTGLDATFGLNGGAFVAGGWEELSGSAGLDVERVDDDDFVFMGGRSTAGFAFQPFTADFGATFNDSPNLADAEGCFVGRSEGGADGLDTGFCISCALTTGGGGGGGAIGTIVTLRGPSSACLVTAGAAASSRTGPSLSPSDRLERRMGPAAEGPATTGHRTGPTRAAVVTC